MVAGWPAVRRTTPREKFPLKDSVQPAQKPEARAMLAESRIVAPEELPLEFLMNALRLDEGFELELFEARTGQPLRSIEDRLAALAQRDLLHMENNRVKTSCVGKRYLNDLLMEFM